MSDGVFFPNPGGDPNREAAVTAGKAFMARRITEMTMREQVVANLVGACRFAAMRYEGTERVTMLTYLVDLHELGVSKDEIEAALALMDEVDEAARRSG